MIIQLDLDRNEAILVAGAVRSKAADLKRSRDPEQLLEAATLEGIADSIDEAPDEPVDRILNINEVARRLSVSRPLVYKMVDRGEIPPPARLGGHRIGWAEETIAAVVKRIAAAAMEVET